MVRDGTTLVEVAVALVLAAIGVSAVASAGTGALRLSRQTRVAILETAYAGAVADSLATLGAVRPDSVRIDGIAIVWTVGAAVDGAARVVLRTERLILPFLVTSPLPVVE